MTLNNLERRNDDAKQLESMESVRLVEK